MDSAPKSSGVRGVSWQERETADLIAIWGDERIQESLASSHKNLEVFENVARQMRSLGYSRTASECRTKTKALRADYKAVVSHNKGSGRAPATCPFFKELDSILHGDGSARPKRISRPTKMRPASTAHSQPRPLSQLLFDKELVTIDHDAIRCSTPSLEDVPPLNPPHFSQSQSQRTQQDRQGNQKGGEQTLPLSQNQTNEADSSTEEEDQAPDSQSMGEEIEETDEGRAVHGDTSTAAGELNRAEAGSGNNNQAESPLAEIPARERLEIQRRRPRVAVLAQMSRVLIRHSESEHREMLQHLSVEGERDRAFLGTAFDRNFHIMESAVAIMSDIRDIMRARASLAGQVVSPQPALENSCQNKQPRPLLLAPADITQRPQTLAEDTQIDDDLISHGQELIVATPETPQPSNEVVKASIGKKPVRSCRGQKRIRFSP